MNIKPLFRALICLLSLCASSNAQKTFKPNKKEPTWTYNTIAELHHLAKEHLANLDTQIANKKKASESMLNLFFKKKAQKRHNELVSERKEFLDQTWICPHKHWQNCKKCGGSGNRNFMGYNIVHTTCSVCNGEKGHFEDRHPIVDAEHSCTLATIRALLKVAD